MEKNESLTELDRGVSICHRAKFSVILCLGLEHNAKNGPSTGRF